MAIRERYDLQHVFKNLQQACIYLGKLGVARIDLEYCVYGLRTLATFYPAVSVFVALQSTGPLPPPPIPQLHQTPSSMLTLGLEYASIFGQEL